MSDPVGTAGAIQYYVNSSTFGGNSSVLQLDTSNNRLGINNASPSVVLDVREAADTNTDMYLINPSQTTDGRTTSITFGKDNSTNDSGRLQYSANTVQANRRIELNHYGYTGQFSLLNGGNVGIGTSAPTNKLSVVDNSIGNTVSANFGSTTIDGSTREGGIQLHGSAGSADKTWGIWNDADPILLRFEYLGARGTAFDAGTDVLTLDYSGKVGIGTAAPTAPLTVQGSDGGTIAIFNGLTGTTTRGLKLSLGTDGVTNNVVNFDAQHSAGILAFQTGGTERARITAAGKVGIGTSSPGAELDVHGTGTVAQLESSSSQVLLNFKNSGSGAYEGIGSNGTRMSLYTANTERVSINADGKVGIGTTGPTALLSLDGGTDDWTSGLQLNNNSNYIGNIYMGGAATNRMTFYNRNTGGGSWDWMDSGTGSGDVTYMTLTGGKLGIGGTPTEELEVFADAPSVQLTSSNASGRKYGLQSDNTGLFAFYDGTAGANRLVIDKDGLVGIGTGSPACTLHIADTVPEIRLSDTDNVSFAKIQASAGGLEIGADDGANLGSSNIQFQVDNAEVMRMTASGNVGIGTTGPVRKLHIAGTAGDGRIRISNSGAESSTVIDLENDDASTEMGIYASAADAFQIWHGTSASAVARLTIQTGGNVGIGTASPGEKLEVSGTIKCTTLKFADGTTLTSTPTATVLLRDLNPVVFNYDMSVAGALGVGTTSPGEKLHVNGGDVFLTDDGNSPRILIGDSTSSGNYSEIQHVSSDDSLRFRTTGYDRMTILEGGKVGIGTTAPGAKLGVVGAIHSFGTGVTPSATSGFQLAANNSNDNGYLWNFENADILFATNNTERVRITAAGKVGIGKTPATMLDIACDGSGVKLSRGTVDLRVSTNAASGAVGMESNHNLYIRTNATNQITVTNAGKVGIGTTTPLAALHIRKATDLGTNFRAAGLGSTAVLFDISNYHDGAIISMLESKHSANDSLPPATRIASKVTGNGSLLLFGTTNSYSGGINNTALTINSVGRIGINTETPSSNLDIYKSDTGDDNEVRLRRSDLPSTYCEWSYNSGTSIFGTVGSDHLSLKTNGAHRIYIHGSSGNVGIATTSPSYTLDVDGTIRCSSLMFQDGTTFSSVSGVGQKAIAVNIGNGSSNVVVRARSVVDASYGGIKNGMVIVYYYWYYTYRCGNGTCGANHYQKSVYNVIDGAWTHIFDF